MDSVPDGDHAMGEGNIIITTEINGFIPQTLDPSRLALEAADEVMSMSPDMPRILLQDSNGVRDVSDDLDIDDPESGASTEKSSASQPRFAPLPYATSRTGLVYDVRMRFHIEPIPRDQDMHPEDPRRIFEVYTELVQAGLVDDPTRPGLIGEYVLLRIPVRSATREEILACHSVQSYDFVMSLKDWDDERLFQVGETMDSVYLSVNTPACALLAAGGAIEACRAVMNNQVKNSIAVIRPPGHHAEHDHPMGFCFFNNVPVAARACQKEFGDAARKILILDWDVHHGNGVQNIFYDDPNVLYISLHVDQSGAFYPPGPEKNHLHCGSGAGVGLNVNIPWKTAGMGDGDYVYAFQQVVMPIAQDFDPDLVFVCAGFDAAEGDMIGGCHVTPAGYAHMTHMLMSLAKGKLVVCMEGGYNLRSIAVSALAVTRTLMGEQPERLQTTQPSPAGVDTVQMVLRQQSQYWPCLYPKDPSKRLKQLKGERMHDIVREWQANTLYQDHEMTPLFIARNKLSKSFENQVLATSNYTEPRPLLLIFHDPPELTGTPDPRTQTLELHNTFLTDGVKEYTDWAVNQGFAVIDVNIPKHLSSLEAGFQHTDSDPNTERAKEALVLATYLWENYVELGDATHMFIVGVGAAYSSIIQLLQSNERIADRINKIFFFVSEQSLHSCKSATDDSLSQWYYETSFVFVAQNHHIWDLNQKKPKKRFGTLLQSPYDGLQEMLAYHKDIIVETMMTMTAGWEEALEEGEGDQGPLASGLESEDELTTPSARKVIPEKGMPQSPVRLPPVGNFALSPRGRRSPGKGQ